MSVPELPMTPEEPASGMRARDTLREIALFLPRFVVLLKRLISDPRVPIRSKWLAAGVLVYLVSPIDVIPDFIPGIGQLDDVVLVLLALHGLLNRVDEEIIVEHWAGDVDVIRMVRAGFAAAVQLLPGHWERRV